MEGGMGIHGNLLDPGAQEFYPTNQFALVPAQIYYPYPLPPPPIVPAAFYHHQQPHPSPAPAPADDALATRAVLLSTVPPHVTEATVRAEMAAFGGVRAVEMGALASDGIVTVHFYDLRSAQAAVAEIREQHVRQQSRLGHQFGLVPENWGPWDVATAGAVEMPPDEMGGRGLIAGQAVWAQFAAKGLDVPNQGSLFVFTSADPALSLDDTREIFQVFGPVKEVRATPSKPHHKFVEFFDVRDAARALAELNGKEILGRRLVIEFSRPGGQATRRFASGERVSSLYPKKSSGHQNFPLPPRLVRNTSRWGQGGERGEERFVLLKRNDHANMGHGNFTRNGNGSSSSTSGKRNKSGGSSSCLSAPSTVMAASSSSSSSKQQQQQHPPPSRKSWKNHAKNSGESRYLFKGGGEESASSSGDSRTTVMIKNIPNKYSQKLLLNMLDNHCIHCNEQIGDGGDEPFSAYDFVYLPIDFNNKCNVGYGFVNLTSPEATVRLYRAFHMQPWEVFNSRKICQVTYARLQGLEALKEHFKNSKFACDNDEYMPVVFSPPRDGTQLTDPVPIGGRGAFHHHHLPKIRLRESEPSDLGGASSTTTSTHAPSDHADGGDDDRDDVDEVEDVGGGDDDDDDETATRLSQALFHLPSYDEED